VGISPEGPIDAGGTVGWQASPSNSEPNRLSSTRWAKARRRRDHALKWTRCKKDPLPHYE
jgi:hypothetical protein